MNEWLRKLLALPKQASTMASEVDDLHFFVITVTMLGALLVAAAAIYFVVRYRRRGRGELTQKIKIPFFLEATFVVGLLGIFIFWWVIGFQRYIKLRTPPEQSMEVYVTGKQWMWKFAYPDGRSAVNVLTVPANRPVKLFMTSRDVIHSFYVPEFRIKQDVLPGRYTTTWFEATEPGTYQIFCSEYCGVSHSRMLGEVVVLSPKDYEEWLEGGEPVLVAQAKAEVEMPEGVDIAARADQVQGFPALTPRPTMAARGREVAVKHGCFSCHTTDGRRHIGPTWLELYGRPITLQDGETLVADAAYLTESMMDPTAKVVAGFVPVMPTYQGILEASEAAALVEYIKSLKDGGPPTLAPLPAGSLPALAQAPGSVVPGRAELPTLGLEAAATTGPEGGRALAQQYGCLSCHTTDGRRLIGPTWSDLAGSEVQLQTGERVRADDEYLRESIRNPKAKVVSGFTPVMPSYEGLLKDEQIDSLVSFIRSLRHDGAQGR